MQKAFSYEVQFKRTRALNMLQVNSLLRLLVIRVIFEPLKNVLIALCNCK